MDPKSGLPPEILVLCTTTETKEKAVSLWDWIRHIPENLHGSLAWEPAIPAICSLIASEQLGNTVVTERRAQQWSQSTPEHFKAVMGDVRKLLVASRMQNHHHTGRITLQALVADYCPDQNVLGRVLMVEKAFVEANGQDRWHLESDIVQLSLFIWSCRQFKIHTTKSAEEIQLYYDPPATGFNEIQEFLDDRCLPTFFTINSTRSPRNTISSNTPQETPRQPEAVSSSVSTPAVTRDETTPGDNSVRLEDLAREFGVADDVLGGMRFLDTTIRESQEFKGMVDWSSTMGRCVIFYWTCSVLKIPGAKHITLRNRFQLSKRKFDKLLSGLDVQRSDLRKKLETFYAETPAALAKLFPQSSQWTSTAPTRSRHMSPASVAMADRPVSPTERAGIRGIGRRGRPPKLKSPVPMSVDPIDRQEHGLLTLCTGPTLRRALLLLRSFNAKRVQASTANRIPPDSLPPLIAFVASRQLGNDKFTQGQAMTTARLLLEDFNSALATVRSLVDIVESTNTLARQTSFDDLVLENGLGIDALASMLQVREALKESRCLSDGMDWDSPLVKCSVFFWTCAILKVPDIKQSLLRSRSLVSKREFDSMLQLLNSHCSAVRHQLEGNSTAGTYVFAPPPHAMPPTNSHRKLSISEEHQIQYGGRDGTSAKRHKSETMTPSEVGSDAMENQRSNTHLTPRKRGRPLGGHRKPLDGPSDLPRAATSLVQELGIYAPTTQFPPLDWNPPESLSDTVKAVPSVACPSSETGESKRRHTRYSTADYQDIVFDRVQVWKPDGEEALAQETRYRQWEENMARHYGPRWENNIIHVKPGIPFE